MSKQSMSVTKFMSIDFYEKEIKGKWDIVLLVM